MSYGILAIIAVILIFSEVLWYAADRASNYSPTELLTMARDKIASWFTRESRDASARICDIEQEET